MTQAEKAERARLLSSQATVLAKALMGDEYQEPTRRPIDEAKWARLYDSWECGRGGGNDGAGRARRWGARVERVDREAIIRRDHGRCYICGRTPRREEIQLDHIIPLKRGGNHGPDNLAVACARCNADKGDMLLPMRPPALRGIRAAE